MRRLALTALCAGGTLGAAGLAIAPGSALAATKLDCSNVYSSGSTLQTKVQQSTFTALAAQDKAFANCAVAPSVFYNTAGPTPPAPTNPNQNEGGTGSGAGLTEFALQGSPPAVTPSKAETSTIGGSDFLDGFIGTDDPPSASAMTASNGAAGTDPEPIPVVQAPVSIPVNLPAGCTITKAPIITNTDLSAAFDDAISWNTLLTDAGAKPSGCSTTAGPTVEVRFDGSGTSYATTQYLSQINPAVWSGVVSDTPAWPAPVSKTYVNSSGATVNNQGSGGEAQAVLNTVGSIGYVNAADGAAAGFGNWAAGESTFWVKVQNNGATTGKTVTGAYPVASTGKGACPATYTGGNLPPVASKPDWTGVHVANPKVAATSYPLCTLTYDVAWNSYVGDSTIAAFYNGNYTDESPTAVENTTRLFLTWLVGTASKQGQTVVPTYYTKLPTTIASLSQKIVKAEVGIS